VWRRPAIGFADFYKSGDRQIAGRFEVPWSDKTAFHIKVMAEGREIHREYWDFSAEYDCKLL
jgi:hypothetical protein